MNLGSIALISMIVWNDKYLLLFEKEKNYILLFNLLTGRIETKFNYENKDNYLLTGKKLVINDKAHSVLLGKREIDLTPKEYALLKYFVI